MKILKQQQIDNVEELNGSKQRAALLLIKEKYVKNEITAENALQEVLNLYGVEGSICKCEYKEWIEKEDGLHCPNCNKLTLSLE